MFLCPISEVCIIWKCQPAFEGGNYISPFHPTLFQLPAKVTFGEPERGFKISPLKDILLHLDRNILTHILYPCVLESHLTLCLVLVLLLVSKDSLFCETFDSQTNKMTFCPSRFYAESK